MKRKIITIAAIALIVLLAGGIAGWSLATRHSSLATASSGPIAEPKAGAKTPPAGWLAKYDRHMALVKEIERRKKNNGIAELEAEQRALAQELNRAIPQGFDWNPASMSFEPKAAAPAPPQP